MNSVSPSQHPSSHSNLLLHAKPGTHVPTPSGPLIPKPTAVFPISLSSYFDHIIRTGSNCTYTFGFSYIFLSVSGALYFHSGLSKQFVSTFCFSLTERFCVYTSLQLNSACWGSSVMETLTGRLAYEISCDPTAAQNVHVTVLSVSLYIMSLMWL